MSQAEGFGLLRIRGDVEMTLVDVRTGQIKASRAGRNLVVTVGAEELAKIVASSTSGTRPTHMAIGTSTTAPAAAQTDMQGTATRRSLTSTTRSTNQITYSCTFTTGIGTFTVEEAGLFNAAVAGQMFARWLTGSFTKGASDALTVTWRLTFGTM